MPEFLDYLLVVLAVTASAAYLVWRKTRSLKRTMRDWSTGHSEELCDSCPVIKIRREQQKPTESVSPPL